MNHISFKQVQTAMRLLGIVMMAGVLALHSPSPAYAASIPVTTPNDELNADGDCSLREAVRAANTNKPVDGCPEGSSTATDTITVPAGTYNLSLVGSVEDEARTGDLDLTGKLNIVGAGVGATVISGVNEDRVFDVRSGTITISQLYITDGTLFGFAQGGAGVKNKGKLTLDTVYLVANTADFGGAIENDGTLTVLNTIFLQNESRFDGGVLFNWSKRSATLTQSTLHNNIAGRVGGGIRNLGKLTVINSTIDFNRAGDEGGGIFNDDIGTVTINNGTFTINEADTNGDGVGNGGGIYNAGALTVQNTILTHNVDVGGEAPDCAGPLTSGGYNLIFNPAGCSIGGTTTGNLIGVFSPLGPLDNNGGPTSTRMPDPGSAVLDAGSPSTPGSGGSACAAKDQRGVKRPRDGNGDGTARCDIGAVER